MATRLIRLLLILTMPLILSSCLFAPGKFTSTLSINADRSFAFSFLGEVISVDPSGDMAKGMAGMMANAGKATTPTPSPTASAAAKAEADRKNQQIAETLSKEAGYRKVTYLGDGRFMVDYAIRGTLDHDFVYPFNLDAEAIFPFIALELRQGGTVRVKAPAFAKGDDKNPMAGMGDTAASKLDGVFTLDTDAEIVSQNNEEGVKTVGGRKTITWKATPLTKDAPTAVLRFAGGK
ncbi:hypothetical protein [Sphingomonas bacterium]|uniref:hypothetical protein n=1 Tax=Sphingomonas bacterium TaxID=1895847 RepID=UPI0020C6153C|nr:hypothetical protein [Sphingomonas bacterium]